MGQNRNLNFRCIYILMYQALYSFSYNHQLHNYKNLNKIIKSVKFNPDAIFFYVKLNKNLDYPDKDWAVNIANVKKLTKQIIKIKK